jgi:FAD binding domain-containing protein/berberine-like enzyme
MGELRVVATAGSHAMVGTNDLDALRAALRGPLLLSGDEGYDEARTVWNALIDHRPALIARCSGAADVVAAVQFARQHNLLVSIKGGGHGVAGKAVCDGGLMIDLSRMKSIRVDPVARIVRAEPGVLGTDFDRETQAFGLATPVGTVSTTGIAGLTLGGGQSWLGSKFGFAIDNLLSVDIVTADGTLRTASPTQYEDLFWGIRGAGHNFGVVTSFEYRLHPVGPVLGGLVIHPLSEAVNVLRFYRDFTASQPDELQTWAGILTTPDGNPVVALVPCYVGSLSEGERLLAPLRRFGSPVADTVAPIPYVAMQTLLDAALPHGRLGYWKTGLTNRIDDAVIGATVEYANKVPSPHTIIIFAELHGAYSRIGKTDTAYYHRDMQYDLIALSVWTDPADTERNIRWTRDIFAEWEPHLAPAAYVNDLGDEGEERVRSAYGENYARLVALKAKYDPTDFFCLNQNIKPIS